eukprot:3503158-Pleurochrysis_carterae.AAC.3
MLPGARNWARESISARMPAKCSQSPRKRSCAAPRSVPETGQVADNGRAYADVETVRVIDDEGFIRAAQSKKAVEKVKVVVLQQALCAVFVVVNHAQADNSQILRRLRRVR